MENETMNIKELYTQLEADSKGRANKGEKAERIRLFIIDVAAKLKQDRLLSPAVYKLCKMHFKDEKIDRPYFTSVVSKRWETERDEDGVWILIKKDKRPVPQPPQE